MKANCPRNNEQIFKCKLHGVGCAFQMKLVLSKNDQTVRLFDLLELTNYDALKLADKQVDLSKLQ